MKPDAMVLSFKREFIEELGELFPRVGFIVTHLRYPVKGIVNFFKRLAPQEAIKRWSVRIVQTKLIKTSGRLVRQASKLVFQLAEIMVTMKICGEMLEMIGRLRPVPS